ncbi:LysR substrate-binding domain-containing protein [Falsiruegeria mediterranea]|uniref:HTH-type transcriptional activator CmpR n=1 Tax=Falsiruegeria mediterranea M17 TaxID=1200281 RepID=A0A2R8CBF4_9RHOB|nr:LysR substrate-binding domain-containing protein [Falsiruegeria mediterranea]SPJ29706.1 HTH-type transcriptional activator CmpR [Falsiruegeria mediterranea M17]
MNFTLKQLRYFDAALRNGSIARAAVEMNISQSSITAAIDMIEQCVGAELFRRVPAKGIVATQVGKRVGDRVSAFLDTARVFESDLMSLTGDPTGTLRLGCYAPTAPYVLPPILSRLAQRYPGIRIELAEGDMTTMADLLHSGGVDLALTYQKDPVKGLPFDQLFEAHPWALLPNSSPLASKPSVSLHDLAELPMILLDLPLTEEYFCSLFEELGLEPNVVHSTKSSSVLRGLVASEFGYSILNICGPNDRDGRNGYRALPISDSFFSPALGLAYVEGLKGSAIVSAVRNITRELKAECAFDHLIMQPEFRKTA